jgi:hypothetical protein
MGTRIFSKEQLFASGAVCTPFCASSGAEIRVIANGRAAFASLSSKVLRVCFNVFSCAQKGIWYGLLHTLPMAEGI